MNFTTVLDKTADIDIYGLGENESVDCASFTIEWTVEFEAREWGIKDIYKTITNIFGEYEVQVIDGDDNETYETRTFDFEPYRENVTFTAKFTDYNSLSVEHIEIDLGEKTVEVS